jgi:hypothetical protein
MRVSSSLNRARETGGFHFSQKKMRKEKQKTKLRKKREKKNKT